MKLPEGETLKNEYEGRFSSFKNVCDEAKFLLYQEIDRHKIPYHSLEGRVKPFASFSAKVKQQGISRPFDEIHDLVGLRVVCFFRSDLHEIAAAVRRLFQVQSEENKATTHRLEEFGYEAIHLDVKFRDGSYKLETDIIFEVQIRTIAQDAWASVSHYLDYKKEYFISDIVRKDLFALGGLFYVADTQFEMLKHRYKEQRI